MARRRIGVWLLGAKGGVAATAITGLCALKKGLVGTTGLVSELPLFSQLPLPGWNDLVVGGHEIRDVSLSDEVRRMHEISRVFDTPLLDQCDSQWQQVEKEIQPGSVLNVGGAIEQLASAEVRALRESPREVVERIGSDIQSFAERHDLDDVVVVNVASTEPPTPTEMLPKRWAELEKTLEGDNESPLPASALYAIAALDRGYPYVNFTPSLGSALPAVDELARLRGTCHMGRDGKTGETLLKSVLAPMFAHRHLEVLSWVGHNIFGNLDAQVLDDPGNKQSKIASKDHIVGPILGYQPQTRVSIEYVQSMGDWKTAWDHIHFRGFLDTPMSVQFTWQGCDSLLAAPLVLDLVRLTACAHQAGAKGSLSFLASFFKSPQGVETSNFFEQFALLTAWAADPGSH